MTENQYHSEGFSKIDKSFFRIPNDFIEEMAHIDALTELKVILYIMRHTWGFQEFEQRKKITLDEFAHGRKLKDCSRMDSGTGLSTKGVIQGLSKAVEHGFIEVEIDDSDRARIKKYYRLKLKPTAISQEPRESTKILRLSSTKTDQERLLALQAMPYAEYLLTPEWQKKRMKALRFAQFRCQLCNSPDSLNVHHRTYERRGNELLGDLITLCRDCHEIFHRNRELDEGE